MGPFHSISRSKLPTRIKGINFFRDTLIVLLSSLLVTAEEAHSNPCFTHSASQLKNKSSKVTARGDHLDLPWPEITAPVRFVCNILALILYFFPFGIKKIHAFKSTKGYVLSSRARPLPSLESFSLQ